MEVLAVGEKIKRARIYKGYTLKDVCGEEISVSKLSCIENGKVNPEEWILKFISSKLDLDIEYLNQGVDEQVKSNIKNTLNNRSENYLKELQYNLEVTEKYEYYDIALNIIHLIFNHMMENGELREVQRNIGRYYDISNSATSRLRKFMYYMDVAKYFYKSGEYHQAINYFKNARKALQDSKDKDIRLIEDSMAYEASTYIKLQMYDKAQEMLNKLKLSFENIEDELKKAKIYQMMAILSLRLGEDDFEECEAKAYEMYGDNREQKAMAIYDFASTMFQIGLMDKAIKYLREALLVYPRENEEKLVEFMIICTSELVINKSIEFAEEICEDVLNRAINLDNLKFIEKAYYLKSKLLLEEKNFISAEMYMNLSLDSLTKFGSKKEIYDRYMQMGEMYHNMDSTKEAIKYFSLAMTLHKKL